MAAHGMGCGGEQQGWVEVSGPLLVVVQPESSPYPAGSSGYPGEKVWWV